VTETGRWRHYSEQQATSLYLRQLRWQSFGISCTAKTDSATAGRSTRFTEPLMTRMAKCAVGWHDRCCGLPAGSCCLVPLALTGKNRSPGPGCIDKSSKLVRYQDLFRFFNPTTNLGGFCQGIPPTKDKERLSVPMKGPDEFFHHWAIQLPQQQQSEQWQYTSKMIPTTCYRHLERKRTKRFIIFG